MTGTGKSYLACALAQQACRKGHRALYRRVPRLYEELTLAHADGSYIRLLARFARVDVLILDDFAVGPLPDHGRRDLSRSWRTARAPAPPSSPASSRRRSGTITSRIRLWRMRSVTGSFTRPTGLR